MFALSIVSTDRSLRFIITFTVIICFIISFTVIICFNLYLLLLYAVGDWLIDD